MPAVASIGHGLAKVLGIKLDAPESARDDVTRGESVFSIQTTDSFVEEQPTSVEWLSELVPTGDEVLAYIKSLFPFLSWIPFYNLQWLLGDLVAGMYPLWYSGEQKELTRVQASRLEQSSFRREWPMPNLRSSPSNSAYTRRSWAF